MAGEEMNAGARRRTPSHGPRRCGCRCGLFWQRPVCRHVPGAPLRSGFIVCVANLISEQLLPRRALDRGQVRVIVSPCTEARLCRLHLMHTRQRRIPARRHSPPHLLALTTTSGVVSVVCALPRLSRACHAADLPIVQPNIRHATDVRSVSGAQVDPVSRR